jgi:SagB-type dehydrogenase family enzyme
MEKKEKMGYQLLCLILLIVIFILIWHNKRTETQKVEVPVTTEKSAMEEEPAFTLQYNEITAEFKLPQPDQEGGISLMKAFKERKTIRNFDKNKPLSDQQISNLLWAANGINRPDTNKRTVPTASNNQEIDVYLFTEKAIYLYDAVSNTLKLKKEGDYRTQAGKNDFFTDAPVALVYVADFTRMSKYDEPSRNFYSATDVGFVSQNVYLYCASENLATVVCGYIDREGINSILEIPEGKILLSQPVGYPQK